MLDATLITKDDLTVVSKALLIIKDLYKERLQKVIWFGSKVRGDRGEYEDFDLLILADYPIDQRQPARYSEVKESLRNISGVFDIRPFTEEEFLNHPLRNEILETGFSLYDTDQIQTWNWKDKYLKR